MQLFTCGDIGHPASELRRRFSLLEAPLGALPELWWHSPPGRPNCALQKRFGSSESKELVLVGAGWGWGCVQGCRARCKTWGEVADEGAFGWGAGAAGRWRVLLGCAAAAHPAS